ncbi:MAG: hypothetical protein ACI4RF_01530 [Eubacterium sp.]
MLSPDIPYRSVKEIIGNECGCEKDGCLKTSYHYADISVPIELKPKATLGKTVVECCGEPTVECSKKQCGNTCEVIVKQNISIRMPIYYEVDVSMGETSIDCGGAASGVK